MSLVSAQVSLNFLKQLGLPNIFKKFFLKKTESHYVNINQTSEGIQMPVLSFRIPQNLSKPACLKANFSIDFQISYLTLEVIILLNIF